MFANHTTPDTFVFDMDGTLLNEHHELSPLTIRTLQELKARSAHLIIATGRHYRDIRAYLEQLGGGIAAITANGAMIHNGEGELISCEILPLTVNATLLPLAEQFDVHLNMYTDSEWLVTAPCESMLSAHAQSQFFYRQIKLEEMLATPALKILFYGENKKLQAVREKILQSGSLPIHLTFSDDYYLEAMPQNISKGYSLTRLMKRLNLPLANAIAFGDGFNDVEMFRAVAHPVIMDNASEKLKQLFPTALRALPNHKDGVAKFILEHLL